LTAPLNNIDNRSYTVYKNTPMKVAKLKVRVLLFKNTCTLGRRLVNPNIVPRDMAIKGKELVVEKKFLVPFRVLYFV
jgi:hypothetical protein